MDIDEYEEYQNDLRGGGVRTHERVMDDDDDEEEEEDDDESIQMRQIQHS
jgi:hypothetical protein